MGRRRRRPRRAARARGRPTSTSRSPATPPGRAPRSRAPPAAIPSSSPASSRPGAWPPTTAPGRRRRRAARRRRSRPTCALRDFTVNAIAVPLGGGEPIDPTGGIADLEAGVLRAASERAFADDPLRILRAARIAAGARPRGRRRRRVELARAAADRAGEPAGERQFAELAALVAGPDPLRGDRAARRARRDRRGPARARGAARASARAPTTTSTPTATRSRCCGASLEVEARPRALRRRRSPARSRRCSPSRSPTGSPARDGLRFAALLHDIGKPATRQERDGWVSFIGHDAVGAEMIRDLCRRLRTSRAPRRARSRR